MANVEQGGHGMALHIKDIKDRMGFASLGFAPSVFHFGHAALGLILALCGGRLYSMHDFNKGHLPL